MATKNQSRASSRAKPVDVKPAPSTAVAAHDPPPVMGGDDLLGDMIASATKETAAPKSKKDDRATVELQGAEAEALDRFCKAKVVCDRATGVMTAAKTTLQPIIARHTFRDMVQAGTKVPNRRYQTGKSKVIFQVTKRMSLKLPDVVEGETPQTVQERFEATGLNHDRSKALAALFKRETVLTMVPFNDLMESNKPLATKILGLLKGCTPEEVKAVQAALGKTELAKKVISLIEGLSNNERKDALRVTTAVKPVDDPELTISKMASICRTPEELALAMQAAGVVVTISPATYSGDLAEATQEVLNAPAEADPEPQYSRDRAYRFEISGKKVLIFQGDEEEAIGEKTCTDQPHARNTVRKLITDSDYLKKTLDGR